MDNNSAIQNNELLMNIVLKVHSAKLGVDTVHNGIQSSAFFIIEVLWVRSHTDCYGLLDSKNITPGCLLSTKGESEASKTEHLSDLPPSCV